MKNKPTEKNEVEDQRVRTIDLFKYLKKHLSFSCPKIKESTKEEEKLYFIYKQFHDNPYYGSIFKEIYLGHFPEQDLNDFGLIISEKQASISNDELDYLYNYYVMSHTKNDLISNDSKTNEDTEIIRNQIALFSPLRIDFTEIYLKEISFLNFNKFLLFIVNMQKEIDNIPLRDQLNNRIDFFTTTSSS